MSGKQEWFKDWFDTQYYHILYAERDDIEAELFMKKLTTFLQIQKHKKILDMPCGRGRHAIYLNSLGYNVTGADIAKNSLAYAKQFENDLLHFEYHDMRSPFETKFDAIFNLFTSFGYFDDATNVKVLKNLKNGLEKNGVLVIDFLNVYHVEKNLVQNETVRKNNIDFNITRSITGDYILKDIMFKDNKRILHFTERVKYITPEKFKEYFEIAGLKLKYLFGDYNLSKFNKEKSSRLIMIAK